MNYDQARELRGGGWHWTSMNDGHVRGAAPCHRYIGPRFDPTKPIPPYDESQWESCPPHATKEEAERHFYDYSLECVEMERYASWQDCAVCGEPTKMGLANRGMSGYFGGDALCAEHMGADRALEMLRDREPDPASSLDIGRANLAELHPFKAGIELIHS